MSQFFNVDAQKRQRISESKVENAFEITPSDSLDLAYPTTAIYVGVSGNIKLKLSGGGVITLTNLVAGAWHPISAVKVFASDTTCTEIVGAY